MSITTPPELAELRAVAESVMAAAELPGLIIALAHDHAPTPLALALGSDATGRALAADTLFPVASITKLASALAVLRLVDAGTMGLDEPLAWHLPDAAAARDRVTIRRLLAHSAGLPLDLADDQAPYAEGLDWPQLRAACLRAELAVPPGSEVIYSNVGYGLLAAAVERHTRQSFAEALRDLVLAPLGITGYLGQEPPHPPAVLARVRGPHAGGALEPFNSPFWRGLALPWAGLVTDAAGALALVRAFAGLPAGFLKDSTRAEATRNQNGDLAGGFVAPLRWDPCPWGLGADLRGHKQPHWTGRASEHSFGHSGASGTLAWYDPDAQLAWVILGTRPADNGWLLRRSPELVAAILESQTP
jgi:CubicO group peptidase (beta-lactamase class C family)